MRKYYITFMVMIAIFCFASVPASADQFVTNNYDSQYLAVGGEVTYSGSYYSTSPVSSGNIYRVRLYSDNLNEPALFHVSQVNNNYGVTVWDVSVTNGLDFNGYPVPCFLNGQYLYFKVAFNNSIYNNLFTFSVTFKLLSVMNAGETVNPIGNVTAANSNIYQSSGANDAVTRILDALTALSDVEQVSRNYLSSIELNTQSLGDIATNLSQLADIYTTLNSFYSNFGYGSASNRTFMWDMNELFTVLNGGYQHGGQSITALLSAINTSIQNINISGGSGGGSAAADLEQIETELATIVALLRSTDGNLEKVVDILEDADFQIIVNLTQEINTNIENSYNNYTEIENNYITNFNTEISGVEGAISDWDIGDFAAPISFVGAQFTSFYNALGDYKIFITAPLILGFVLVFIGRGKRVL